MLHLIPERQEVWAPQWTEPGFRRSLKDKKFKRVEMLNHLTVCTFGFRCEMGFNARATSSFLPKFPRFKEAWGSSVSLVTHVCWNV